LIVGARGCLQAVEQLGDGVMVLYYQVDDVCHQVPLVWPAQFRTGRDPHLREGRKRKLRAREAGTQNG
jgi:hypothetical protein